MNGKIKTQLLLGKLLRKFVLALMVFSLFACKGNDELKKQVSDLTTKLEEANTKLSRQDEQLRSANSEIKELKGLVAKLGNAVVDLRKANESRSAAKPKKKMGARHRKGSKRR